MQKHIFVSCIGSLRLIDGDKSQNGGYLTERGRRKFLKVMKMFNILILVIVTWLYAYIKFTKLYT